MKRIGAVLAFLLPFALVALLGRTAIGGPRRPLRGLSLKFAMPTMGCTDRCCTW
jgi:hypothetical protein